MHPPEQFPRKRTVLSTQPLRAKRLVSVCRGRPRVNLLRPIVLVRTNRRLNTRCSPRPVIPSIIDFLRGKIEREEVGRSPSEAAASKTKISQGHLYLDLSSRMCRYFLFIVGKGVGKICLCILLKFLETFQDGKMRFMWA